MPNRPSAFGISYLNRSALPDTIRSATDPMSATRARFALPHPLTLLTGCTILAAALSWIVPAGQYGRRDDPATGKRVVTAGIIDTIVSGLVSPLEHLRSRWARSR